jgi:hypothetical protein
MSAFQLNSTAFRNEIAGQDDEGHFKLTNAMDCPCE